MDVALPPANTLVPNDDAATVDAGDGRPAWWASVAAVVLQVAAGVETAERFVAIRADLLALDAGVTADALPQGVTAELFESVLGTDSRTARALKMVNQAAVFEGMFVLKQALRGDGICDGMDHCRDLRGARGWAIHLELGPGRVSVTHVRREICGDLQQQATWAGGSFELEWRLRMSFDGELAALHAVDLRLTDVTLSDAMPPTVREHTRLRLAGGHLQL